MILTSPAKAIRLSNRGEENNPFVAWNNQGAVATLGGTTVLTGGDRANAVTGSTYDKWRPVSGVTTRQINFDFGVPRSINFGAIVAHNLGTIGGTVAFQYSTNGTTWTDAGTGEISPEDNSVIMFRADDLEFQWWRFWFTNMPTNALLSVGVAFVGADLVIPRRFYQGFSPVITPTEVELQSNVSVGNELLGSSVIGRGSSLQANLTNIDPAFFRGARWKQFQTHFNEGGGFFFGWRPLKYPEDGYYCWRNSGAIRASNSGPRDLMAIEMAAQVYNAAT